MKDQVEYRRPDLFRTTHTYLDSNLAINSAVDLARASSGPKENTTSSVLLNRPRTC